MADPTKTCPNCGDIVLDDTSQCLACGYDFVTNEIREIVRNVMPSEGDAAEHQCEKCGALVREHLVRCWKCGAFMRPELADAYEDMRARAPKVEFQPLPDWESPEGSEPPAVNVASSERTADAETDDDSDTYALAGSADDEDEFETDPGIDFELDADDMGGEFDFDGDLDDDFSEPEAPPVRRGESEAPPVRRGSDEAPPPRRAAEQASPEPSPDHAEEVAADSLLDIAMQEEKESAKRHERQERVRKKRAAARKLRRAAGPPRAPKRKKAGPAAGKYRFWMKDVPLHVVDDPSKVKPKPGVLAKATQVVDLGFAEDELLVVSYVPVKSSLFGKTPDPNETRKSVVEHLRKEGSLEELPAPQHWTVASEAARELRFEQPNEYAHETTFGGEPVFGDGRIAITLPHKEDATARRFLVLHLTQFRRFSKCAAVYGAKEFGAQRGIPLDDATEKLTCHYTDQEFEPLVDATYHVHDPAIELEVVGRRCQNCELVVSEDGRKKESIGGKNGKAIGKATCPKCGERFGETTLYSLVPATKSPARKKLTT